jgi:membrane-associated phospholipid phosphatase
VALIAVVLVAYDAVNNLNPLRPTTATAHATRLMRLEMRLHLDPELGLNRWLGRHLGLGRLVGDYYDLAHLGVTLAVLGWIWWRHPARYRMLRNALLGINGLGFIVFWLFPVAPPRMLTAFGFIDVVAAAHSLGSWSSGSLASQANEYAAMPSLHVAWALWCAFAIWIVCKDNLRRVAAVGYAVATGLVVLATANHYFLDVVAGAMTAALAALGAVRLSRRRWRCPEPVSRTRPGTARPGHSA